MLEGACPRPTAWKGSHSVGASAPSIAAEISDAVAISRSFACSIESFEE